MAVASFPPSLVPVRSKPLSGYSSRSSCYYDSNLKEELLEILQDDFSRLRDLISNDRVTDTFWKSLFKHALQPVQEKFQEKFSGILSHIKGKVGTLSLQCIIMSPAVLFFFFFFLPQKILEWGRF